MSLMINDEERREVARRLRELDVTDIGDDRGIVDTPEESGELFARMLEAANDYRPGLHYATSHYTARDAVELFADLIDRPACESEQDYDYMEDGVPDCRVWVCHGCGDRFAMFRGSNPCFCPNCGAEVAK